VIPSFISPAICIYIYISVLVLGELERSLPLMLYTRMVRKQAISISWRSNDLEEQCSVCVTSSKIMVVLSWLIFFNGPDLKWLCKIYSQDYLKGHKMMRKDRMNMIQTKVSVVSPLFFIVYVMRSKIDDEQYLINSLFKTFYIYVMHDFN
jgi:hypothetical protein